jgi:hypothetical protein
MGPYKLVGPEGEVSLTNQEMRILLSEGKIAVNRSGFRSMALVGLGNSIDAFRNLHGMPVRSIQEVI